VNRRHLLKNSLAWGGLVDLGTARGAVAQTASLPVNGIPMMDDLFSRFPSHPI
jgi:hypothetical protein